MDTRIVGRLEAIEASRALINIFDMQVRRDMDSIRAYEYWSKKIQDLPLATLVEALAHLSSGSYQMAPSGRCHCCSHRH